MRILSILFPGFTTLDLAGPMTAWGLLPGTELQSVWHVAGPVPADNGSEFVATNDFSTCWADPDVIFVPGGGAGVFDALGDDVLLDHVAQLGAASGWITSVCNGALILGAAGLIRGYRSACYWYAREELRAFGAIPDERRVVIDRNRASGGGITAGVDFAIALAGRWFGDDVGRLTELLLEYAPQPPYGVGRPEAADAALLAAARSVLEREMPLAVVAEAAHRRGL